MFCEFTKKVAESEIYNECSYHIVSAHLTNTHYCPVKVDK